MIAVVFLVPSSSFPDNNRIYIVLTSLACYGVAKTRWLWGLANKFRCAMAWQKKLTQYAIVEENVPDKLTAGCSCEIA